MNKQHHHSETMALIAKALKTSLSYEAYRALVSKHVDASTSTGTEQTEALALFTKLNDSRMRRLDKTIAIAEEKRKNIDRFSGRQTWLVLTESWCGDAAQTMPAMNAIAENSSNIMLKVALRDENPELMEHFLTNGNKSIPKLIAIDARTNAILGTWGPRPQTATQMVKDYKRQYGTLTPEFKQALQIWYNKDKGQQTVAELVALLA